MPKDLSINAGSFRHTVALQSAAYTTDPQSGEQLLTWSTINTIRCLVEPLDSGSSEVINADQLRGQITHKVTMRWQGTECPIDSTMQLIFQSTRTLRIQSILNVRERNKLLVLHCLEITSGSQ
jgi:head-tail adaptor